MPGPHWQSVGTPWKSVWVLATAEGGWQCSDCARWPRVAGHCGKCLAEPTKVLLGEPVEGTRQRPSSGPAVPLSACHPLACLDGAASAELVLGNLRQLNDLPSQLSTFGNTVQQGHFVPQVGVNWGCQLSQVSNFGFHLFFVLFYFKTLVRANVYWALPMCHARPCSNHFTFSHLVIPQICIGILR